MGRILLKSVGKGAAVALLVFVLFVAAQIGLTVLDLFHGVATSGSGGLSSVSKGVSEASFEIAAITFVLASVWYFVRARARASASA